MIVSSSLFNYIHPDVCYQVKNDDCFSVLKNTENGKFDLIITSPPYNVGKSYEVKTSIEAAFCRLIHLSKIIRLLGGNN